MKTILKLLLLAALVFLLIYTFPAEAHHTAPHSEAERYIAEFYKDFPRPANMKKRGAIFRVASTFFHVYDPVLNITRRAHGMAGGKNIHLNIDAWRELNEWQKRELVYHEMAHNVLNMNHPLGFLESDFKDTENIMYPFNGWRAKPDGSNWRSLVRRLKRDHANQGSIEGVD